MAFVNERITEEDRKQYGLDEVWEKYKEDKSITLTASNHPYQWTINKDENILLIKLAHVIDEVENRNITYTREHWFLFYFQGEFFEVRLDREEKFVFAKERPRRVASYDTTWDLLSISPTPKDEPALKERLKEALEEYGENGTFSDNIKAHTTVVCNF